MEILIKATQFILSLSLLIVLHELGHFIPAKLFKIKVEKFYLFFDYKFSLFKKKIGDTVYGIGWIPLGGYVKIAGMIDESMDTEQMAQPMQPWEFSFVRGLPMPVNGNNRFISHSIKWRAVHRRALTHKAPLPPWTPQAGQWR